MVIVLLGAGACECECVRGPPTCQGQRRVTTTAHCKQAQAQAQAQPPLFVQVVQIYLQPLNLPSSSQSKPASCFRIVTTRLLPFIRPFILCRTGQGASGLCTSESEGGRCISERDGRGVLPISSHIRYETRHELGLLSPAVALIVIHRAAISHAADSVLSSAAEPTSYGPTRAQRPHIILSTAYKYTNSKPQIH